MKRILVTGGTGLIGLEVCKRLVARGDELVLLVRNEASARQNLTFPASLFSWNHDVAVPAEALENVDAILHLAGEPLADGRWTAAKKKKILDTRVLGTRRLVEAALQHNRSTSGSRLKTFVHGSAVGIYGERGDSILDRSSERGVGFLPDVVAAWEAEAKKVTEASASQPIRLAMVRTSMVLSAKGGALAKMLPLFKLGLAGRLGFSGAQWMSWIHIDDISRLLIHAVDNPDAKGILEGASPHPVRNRDFTDVLCRELGAFQNVPVPSLALKLLYGEMSSVILESQRVVATGTLESGFNFEFESLDKALENILGPLKKSSKS